MPIRVPWQLSDDPLASFPPADTALRVPDGLLAIGGDLSPSRLINAYRAGIFPWFNAGEPILWWSPDPRTVFDTTTFRLSRSNRKALRHLSHCIVKVDHDFAVIMQRCADIPRAGQRGTWINAEMLAAYSHLNGLGHAHSIGIYDNDVLIGGLYGVSIGRMFFGESMFSALPGASKLALAATCWILADNGYPLLDAQVHNSHLALLGAKSMQRHEFKRITSSLTAATGNAGSWDNLPVPLLNELLA